MDIQSVCLFDRDKINKIILNLKERNLNPEPLLLIVFHNWKTNWKDKSKRSPSWTDTRLEHLCNGDFKIENDGVESNNNFILIKGRLLTKDEEKFCMFIYPLIDFLELKNIKENISNKIIKALEEKYEEIKKFINIKNNPT